MEESISIKGVASYHPTEPAFLDISKQNIIIFGLNGSGKSTISNFLNNSASFEECSLVLEGNFTPFVYNQTFIDENFVKNSMQEGVFTLSKDNADLEARIFEKSNLRDKLASIYKDINLKISEAKQLKTQAVNSTIEEVFEQKRIIEKTSLEPFLKSFKTPKSKFYGKVKAQQLCSNDSIAHLDNEYQSLKQFDNTSPIPVKLPNLPTLTNEEKTLLYEPIVGSSNSQLTSFINELNNQNWVKIGKDNYLNENQKKCPFCQQETIDDKFRTELIALFDKTYDSNVKKIESISLSYENSFNQYIKSIKMAFTSCSIYDSSKNDIEPFVNILEHSYRDNLKLIKSKIERPSLPIELVDLSNSTTPLIDLAENINQLVQVIINKSNKFKEIENDIRSRMWGSVKNNTKELFSLEKRLINKQDINIKKLTIQLNRVIKVGKKVAARISSLRSKTSNIDDTIEKINMNLRSLGLTGFQIVASKEHKNYFILSRNENNPEDQKVFKSLSEGEKTLITFLYFIERCNGSMSKNSDIIDKEKIIVIDDPISSLSQNYIYDIASIIQTRIIKGNRFKKVIILTHSLFFYQELLKLAPHGRDDNGNDKFDKKYQLYRLSKNEYSSIQPMDKGELKNDYQSLWQILKDSIEGNVNPIVLPNVMRNILEYYFGFVHKKERLADILNSLAEKEPDQGFKAFYRYINRSSHSDPTNMGLMVEVDPQAYLERFKAIFEKSDDDEHYNCMME